MPRDFKNYRSQRVISVHCMTLQQIAAPPPDMVNGRSPRTSSRRLENLRWRGTHGERQRFLTVRKFRTPRRRSARMRTTRSGLPSPRGSRTEDAESLMPRKASACFEKHRQGTGCHDRAARSVPGPKACLAPAKRSSCEAARFPWLVHRTSPGACKPDGLRDRTRFRA